jgi:hypothetical protein
MITQGKWTAGRQTREEGVYLVVFQVESLWWRRALDGDGGHLLCLGQHCGFACGKVFKEGPDSCQALVSGAYLVVPLFFEKIEKAPYSFTGKIRQVEPRDFASAIVGYKQQKELQGIPIASNAGRPQSLLTSELILKEGIDERAKLSAAHGLTSWAMEPTNRSNLRPASANRSSVTVRYQLVEAGSE